MAIVESEKILTVVPENIPKELQDRNQWVIWKAIEDKKEQVFNKVPFQVNGEDRAKSTVPETWTSFKEVVEAYENGLGDGIGYVLSESDPYTCIDIDGLESVEVLPALAQEIIDLSYAEISPSGTGIHVWIKGFKHVSSKYKNKNNELGYEIYDKARYISFTGETLNDLPISEGSEINSFIEKVFKREVRQNVFLPQGSQGTAILSEAEIINAALKSKNGERFYKFLFGGWEAEYKNDSSSADMGFLNDLAFYCNKDALMMDRIFRKSSLMRDKWDRQQNGSSYGLEHIYKAISECGDTYKSSKKELNVEWFTRNQNGTSTFLHHILGKKVREEYNIVRYPNAHGDLYYYNKKRGIYEQDSSGRQVKGVIRSFDETLKNSQINEVFRFIEDTCSIVKEISTNYIAVGNGLINFNEKKLEEFSPKHFVIQKVPTNYSSNAYDEFIENTFKKVTQDHEPSIKNIKEMFACVLYPGILVPKLWYLYGKTASNGKSSLINMIQNTFNSEGGNISAISPHKLATNNFSGAAIYGKLSNIVDDNPDFQIEDSGDLKTIITGGYTQIERKGRDSTTVRISTTMIVASNHLPNFSESGNAINRRLWILPFEHNFSKDKDCLSDLETQQKISSQSAREYVLKLAVETVFEMLDNPNPDKLTPNQKCQEILKTFAEQNDPWLDYFAAYEISYFDENTGETVIKDYQNWCKDNMVMPMSNKKFKELVSTRLDVEWKDKRVEINGVSKVKKGFKSKSQQESQQIATRFKLADA